GTRVGDGAAPPGLPGPAFARSTTSVLRKDDDGIPTEPVLRHQGGSGNGKRFDMRFWCFPLPPPGPVKVFVEWTGFDIGETMATFDAHLIRDGASRAVTIWQPDRPR
ncbi:MAG: hypothetical protein M0Z30_00575, partial [Actinomycetota bacterium]|nr:hypothetical protein [Actinomycetota bacterium]